MAKLVVAFRNFANTPKIADPKLRDINTGNSEYLLSLLLLLSMLDHNRSVGKAVYYKLDQVGVDWQRGNGYSW